MKLKSKMSLLVFLTSLSIVSVGFSSWSITAETTAEIGGNIEVDNIIEAEDCLNITNIVPLKYCEYGFMNERNEIVDQGTLKIYYNIDLDNCEFYFSPLNSLNIQILLYVEDETTILECLSGYSIQCSSGIDYSETSNNDLTEITVNFNEVLPNQISSFSFEIIYYFEHQIGSDFKNNIFEMFESNTCEILIESSITAYNAY